MSADHSKHTRGPWQIAEPDDGNFKTVVFDADMMTVATVPTATFEGDANARLIAAAPDMLAALKELLAVSELAVVRSDRLGFAHEAAKSAVAKACGKGASTK